MKIKFLREEQIEDKRLGRHVEHDPRSREFAFGAVLPMGALLDVHHQRFGGPLNQGNLGSCTGNAVAGACNTLPLHTVPSHLLRQSHAKNIYSIATHIDEFQGAWPPEDTGSSGLAAAKAAAQLGLISEYRHAFSVEEAVSALQLGPVITGVPWFEGFDHPDADGYVEISGQVRGGHEFEILGFEWRLTFDDSLVAAENSWGMEWGHGGRFWFTVSTWRKLLEQDGDVTILGRSS